MGRTRKPADLVAKSLSARHAEVDAKLRTISPEKLRAWGKQSRALSTGLSSKKVKQLRKSKIKTEPPADGDEDDDDDETVEDDDEEEEEGGGEEVLPAEAPAAASMAAPAAAPAAAPSAALAPSEPSPKPRPPSPPASPALGSVLAGFVVKQAGPKALEYRMRNATRISAENSIIEVLLASVIKTDEVAASWPELQERLARSRRARWLSSP